MKFFSVLQNVFSINNYRILFGVSFVSFLILLSYLFGIFELPFWNFELLSQSVVWELFWPNLAYIFVASFLNAVLICVSVFRICSLSCPPSKTQSGVSLAGIGLTSLLAACPLCSISVASLLGVTLVASFLAPFYPRLQWPSLGIVVVSLYWIAVQVRPKCDCQVSGSEK